MSGWPSSGGGTMRSGAGSPTSLWNPSNCIGAKPTSALRAACLGVEGVGHALRAECKRAGLQGQAGVGDPEGELALEDVEPFVLLGMDVPGRAETLWHDDLDQAICPAGVVTADLDRLQHAKQPERLTLVFVQRVSELCSLRSDGGHLALPFRLLI